MQIRNMNDFVHLMCCISCRDCNECNGSVKSMIISIERAIHTGCEECYVKPKELLMNNVYFYFHQQFAYDIACCSAILNLSPFTIKPSTYTGAQFARKYHRFASEDADAGFYWECDYKEKNLHYIKQIDKHYCHLC